MSRRSIELAEQILETRKVARGAVQIIGLAQRVTHAGMQGRLRHPDKMPRQFARSVAFDQHQFLHAQ